MGVDALIAALLRYVRLSSYDASTRLYVCTCNMCWDCSTGKYGRIHSRTTIWSHARSNGITKFEEFQAEMRNNKMELQTLLKAICETSTFQSRDDLGFLYEHALKFLDRDAAVEKRPYNFNADEEQHHRDLQPEQTDFAETAMDAAPSPADTNDALFFSAFFNRIILCKNNISLISFG